MTDTLPLPYPTLAPHHWPARPHAQTSARSTTPSAWASSWSSARRASSAASGRCCSRWWTRSRARRSASCRARPPRLQPSAAPALQSACDQGSVRLLGALLRVVTVGGAMHASACRYDAKLRSSLEELFDAELCDWLVTEMAQNRDRKLAAGKARAATSAARRPPPCRLSLCSARALCLQACKACAAHLAAWPGLQHSSARLTPGAAAGVPVRAGGSARRGRGRARRGARPARHTGAAAGGCMPARRLCQPGRPRARQGRVSGRRQGGACRVWCERMF